MGERTYVVYIVASRSRNLYTGITSDLERRIYEHKEGLILGFTKKYRIHRLVYFEVFGDVRAAISREKQVKAWTRTKRVRLIESKNPTWTDLAEEWEKRWKRVERRLADAKRSQSADPSLRSGGQGLAWGGEHCGGVAPAALLAEQVAAVVIPSRGCDAQRLGRTETTTVRGKGARKRRG